VVEGLLRGDTKTRAEFYKEGIMDGWLNRNEVRELEDRNPADGLDEFLVPVSNSAPAGASLRGGNGEDKKLEMIITEVLNRMKTQVRT
jgi:hypothetical protein